MALMPCYIPAQSVRVVLGAIWEQFDFWSADHRDGLIYIALQFETGFHLDITPIESFGWIAMLLLGLGQLPPWIGGRGVEHKITYNPINVPRCTNAFPFISMIVLHESFSCICIFECGCFVFVYLSAGDLYLYY